MVITNFFETQGTSGDFKKIVDRDTVLTSIRNIVTTPKNSRLFLPDYGVDLYKYIFEQLDANTTTQLQSELYSNIRRWEDRINLESVIVEQDKMNNALTVTVRFSFLGATYTEPITITADTFEEIQTDFEIPVSEQLGL